MVIDFIKSLYEAVLARRRLKKRIQEMKKRDPFIYK